MKLLILLDEKAQAKTARVVKALEHIKEDYKPAVNVVWDIKLHNFDKTTWVDYYDGNYGIANSEISKVTKDVFSRSSYDYDHVIFCVDPINWKAPGIGGWNMGSTFNHYYVQQVKVTDSDEWLYKIFAMEIFHVVDDLASEELKINLDKVTKLDFDNDIVHGEHPKYGKPDGKGGYFTDYNYVETIKEFKTYIKDGYMAREKKRAEMLTSYRQLILRLLELLKKKGQPTPFLFDNNHNDGHHH
jgi:hypothetical protein